MPRTSTEDQEMMASVGRYLREKNREKNGRGRLI